MQDAESDHSACQAQQLLLALLGRFGFCSVVPRRRGWKVV